MKIDSVIVRDGNTGDLPAIGRIQEAENESPNWEPGAYLLYRLRVAEYQGAVLGFIVSRELSAGEHEVLNLVVSPDHRRLGVASKLLMTLMDESKGDYYLEVRESNEAARCLYRKLGFEEYGRRSEYYQNPPEAAIVMRFQSC